MEYGFRLVIAVVGHCNLHPFIPAVPCLTAAAIAVFPPAGLPLQCLISQVPAGFLLGHTVFRCILTHIYLYDMTGDLQFFTQCPDKIRIPVSFLSPQTMMDMDRHKLKVPVLFHTA